MALAVEDTPASDVCLLYVTDGGAYDEAIYSRLRNRLEASSRSGNAHSRKSSRALSTASSIDLVVIGLGASQEVFARSSTMSMDRQPSMRFSSMDLFAEEALSFEDSERKKTISRWSMVGRWSQRSIFNDVCCTVKLHTAKHCVITPRMCLL